MGQSLYIAKFIQTLFKRNKIYTVTKFIQTLFLQ
jgi:hypothetical protein